jgi:hypothetical protein
MEKMLIIA